MICGLILIAIGLLIGGKVFGIIDFSLYFPGWWCLFLIVPCFLGIIRHGFGVFNTAGFLFGVAVLLQQNGYIEVELLEKKSSKTKLTIQQKANLKILDTIRGIMAENDKAVTISELIKTEPLKNFTNQKISALMRKLIESGEVEKTQIKKVSYFKLKN